tara:strand:- start:212 stop:391 length:180 start_codon:yes stop_codon:yes gene_type:complete
LEISVQKRIEGFTVAELFQIVATVESYPKFLPFCIVARVLEKNLIECFEVQARKVLNRP